MGELFLLKKKQNKAFFATLKKRNKNAFYATLKRFFIIYCFFANAKKLKRGKNNFVLF